MVWPRLHPKYFGKLFDTYNLGIVRLRLWKIEVCCSWGELRSHDPVFLGVWQPFPLKILLSFIIFGLALLSVSWVGNVKHLGDGLKCTLKWTLISWSQGLIPSNSGELIEWISVLLQILAYLEGQTFWGKWGEITRHEFSVYKKCCHLLLFYSKMNSIHIVACSALYS